MKRPAPFSHCPPARRHCERTAAIHGPASPAMDRHGRQPRDDEKGAVIASSVPVIAREARQSMTLTQSPLNQVYNVAPGDSTTLNILFALLHDNLGVNVSAWPVYRNFRAGEVRHSLADIGKAHRLLGHAPIHRLAEKLPSQYRGVRKMPQQRNDHYANNRYWFYDFAQLNRC